MTGCRRGHKGLVAQGRSLDINLKSGGFVSPPLRRGRYAVQEKWNATLETVQRGRAAQARQRAASREGRHGLQQASALSAAPICGGRAGLFGSARQRRLEASAVEGYCASDAVPREPRSGGRV